MSREIPKLHGWITPEYAAQMIKEMMGWLDEVSNEYWIEVMGEICPEKFDDWD